MAMEKIRLQKYMANAGVCSRRKAEEIIAEGRVSVNGKVVTEMGITVSNEDGVIVDGKEIKLVEKYTYIMLNKPKGYITTAKDQFGRDSVLDLLKGVDARVYPVGRLDRNTTGLLLLTDDGDLTQKLTHPSNEIEKTYKAKVEGVITYDKVEQLKDGVVIDGGFKTSKAKVKITEKDKFATVLEITIHEGKNRQVRKMCEAVGHTVIYLERISEGNLKLGDLKRGEWRHLTDFEVDELKKIH